MNLAVLLSACVAVLQLGMGVLLLAVSRAPGWRQARVFAAIAMSAAMYSVGNIGASYDPMSDQWRRLLAVMSYVMAGVFVAAWLTYAYGGRDGRVRAMPRWARALMIATLASAAFCATGLQLRSGTFTDIVVEWAGLHYRFPTPNAAGQGITLLYLAGVLCVCGTFLQRKDGRRVHREYLFGFSVFLCATLIEVLITNGVIEFFFVADIGFIAVVIPMAAETVRRFIDDSRRLASLSTHLTEEVELRTQERDEVHHAWLEAERQASVGRLAAGVGHEINNPLAYLRLNIELIGEWGREHNAPPDLMESVESALDGADRIRRVVDALRAYSRQGTGQVAPVSTEAVTQAAIRVATHQLRGAELDTVIDEAPAVMGEEAKLVQVVVNLLLNAAQAIAEGNTGRKGVITVRVGTHEGHALIAVGDNGPGISREDLRRLTQPYFTTRANAGAMGLGLFLARGVVEQHGGSLEIESEVGTGTRVRVLLPSASDASSSRLPTPSSALEPLGGRYGTPRSVVSTTPARGAAVGH